MFSQKNLKNKFIFQLVVASTMLILIFSVMLFHYMKITIFENSAQMLMREAKTIANNYNTRSKLQKYLLEFNKENIKITISEEKVFKPTYSKIENDSGLLLVLKYPIYDATIILETDITIYNEIIKQILIDIIIINATMIFLILFYAIFLSRTLLIPIKILSKRLSNLNERVLQHIEEDKVPAEFYPLAISINRLIDRIQTFILYQKELFIGIAHELKTPLAVMKTKNEVTLIKERDSQKYIEALKSNNEAINSMNKMINSILEIGRQESAQFEEVVKKDIISYIENIANNFRILAHSEQKNIILNLSPQKLYMGIQPTLFLHVIQNFVQNAIKFSPENSTITIKSRIIDDKFIVDVIDEGAGIKEDIDLFAPFKRFGNKGGAGLGLFLAKGAAQAMNANIAIKNRNDGISGAVATITIPIKNKIIK